MERGLCHSSNVGQVEGALCRATDGNSDHALPTVLSGKLPTVAGALPGVIGQLPRRDNVTKKTSERATMKDAIQAAAHAAMHKTLPPALFSGLLAISADAVIAVDDEQRIIFFNEGAERIFGWNADEVGGQF